MKGERYKCRKPKEVVSRKKVEYKLVIRSRDKEDMDIMHIRIES